MDAIAVAEANVVDITEPSREDLAVNGDGENKFQKAISAWRNVNLSALSTQLDATAAEIIQHQKDTVIERKDVAQRTKDFRKLDDAGKLAEYKGLLKAYQGFVDLLTTHGKESSTAFLQLYTTLSEVPDPFPLLEASVEALVVSEDTVPKLTNENTELQRRVARLSQDLEETERKLQVERQARKEAEDGSGRKAEGIESSWRQVLEEKEANWTAKEQMLEEKIESQDRLFKELKANYQVSQKLGRNEQETAAHKAASAELQLVSADLDKTSTRLAEMEARNEQLRVELAQASSQSVKTAEDDPQILRLQSENSSLLRKMETMRFERSGEKRKQEDQLKLLERQRKSTTVEIQDLRTKLQKYSDYDEIKRELDMLKSIELSAEDDENADSDDGDDENDGNDEVPANGSITEAKKNSLEQLLLARNKKLSSDLTLLRVAHQEMTEQLNDLKTQLSHSNEELENSQKLSARLENDLVQLQEEAASGLPSSGMSVAGTYISRYPHSSRRGRSSPTSSIISGFDNHSRGSAEPVGGGSSILPMVQAQRDRFKHKTQQLEEELQKTYATVTSLRHEVASLQKDNLNLYEKSRYVSAYSRSGAATSSLGQNTHGSMDIAEEAPSDRWKAQYEANISPFAAFRGREAVRAYKRMNVAERIVFTLTRIVLATRTSRNLFAGYCVALHGLIFLMLYWMSSSSAVANNLQRASTAAIVAGAANVKNAVAQGVD